MLTKICTKCGREKPATSDNFHKHKLGKFGLNPSCRECINKHPVKIAKPSYKFCSKCGKEKPANTDYFIKKDSARDGLLSACKECKNKEVRDYYAANKEKMRLRAKTYKQQNKEKISLYNKQYAEQNKTAIRNRMSAWCRTDNGRSLKRNNERKRTMIIKKLPSNFTFEDWIACLGFFENSCAYCGEQTENLEQDHFVPVSCGGEYTIENIVPACKPCNLSKGSRDFWEWYKVQSFYSADRISRIMKFLKKEGIVDESFGS